MAMQPRDMRWSGWLNMGAAAFAAYMAHRIQIWPRFVFVVAALGFAVYGGLLLWKSSRVEPGKGSDGGEGAPGAGGADPDQASSRPTR